MCLNQPRFLLIINTTFWINATVHESLYAQYFIANCTICLMYIGLEYEYTCTWKSDCLIADTRVVYVGGLLTYSIGILIMAATTFTMPYILVSRYHSDKTVGSNHTVRLLKTYLLNSGSKLPAIASGQVLFVVAPPRPKG